MDAVSIRRAGQDDGESLFAIHRESVLTAYAGVFPPDRYRFPEKEMRAHWKWALAEPDRVFLVAVRSGTPVGFASVSRGWLRNLFVVPGEWGTGVGGALHDSAVGLLRADSVDARLWVLEENERARRFYERRGWRRDGGRQRAEYPPYPVEIRYVLDLREPPDPSLSPTHPGDGVRG